MNETRWNKEDEMETCRQLGGFPHSSHKAIVREDGSLVFDLYFFGDDNYSEYVTTIYVEGEAAVRAREDMERWAKRPLADAEALADAIASRFNGISGARDWMDELRLPYKEVHDPFATDDPAWQRVTLKHGAQ
jgi:hypothetical protein